MPEHFVDNSSREPDEFERALAGSEKAAERRQKQFWVLGIVWVAAVFLAVLYFRSQTESLGQSLQVASTDQAAQHY